MRLFDRYDMVKADCQGCKGCSECCCGMGDSIVLDPLDVSHLMQYLQKSFEELVNESIALHIEDGIILPHVRMVGQENRCCFLSEEGRCTIYTHRPGLCRTFPLGRQYKDGKLKYFLLEEACKKKQHTKVKISKWIAMQDTKDYESFLESWHYFLKDTRERIKKYQDDEQIVRKMNITFLQQFYSVPYNRDSSFLAQFEERRIQFER